MDFLDSDPDDLPLDIQLKIDTACDQFESVWQSHLADDANTSRPSLADHLKTDHPQQLWPELLSLEMSYRLKLGERPSPDDYRSIFDCDEGAFNSLWRAASATESIKDASCLFTDSVESGPTSSGSKDGNPKTPDAIGRFHVRMRVGEGGFGSVYLAYDDVLDRDVAIKMPHLHRFITNRDVEAFLNEARIVAALDHPHIVPVYDFGTTDDDRCYVVAKWIDGESLSERMTLGGYDFSRTAEVVSAIADALHHAHVNQVSHRDIKPANILIDKAGKAYLTDFGMASSEHSPDGRLGGTPAYMSPEQARGEGHLVDARSDIYSLGAVLFEMLCGAPPKLSSSSSAFATDPYDVTPPSALVGNVPKELERICLKATARRAADRYQSAMEFRRDLESFQKSWRPQNLSHSDATAETEPHVELAPIGLRSYTEQDAEQFVQLLPGPYGRDNLPEGIRFWKTRLDATEESAIRVGVIYGPSGCGKSSFVKAGLIPRLGDEIDAIYIEATTDQTHETLRKALHHKFRIRFPADWDLLQVTTAIRQRKHGKCTVVFIDQFEQWLQSWDQSKTPKQMIRVLRQADGERLKFVLMVRDDFWLGLSRLMREVEIPLVEGDNSWLLDLFSVQHAKLVLTRFGQALDKLPRESQRISDDQHKFINRAIFDLCEDGRVICVKLALFTEMMKSRPWTPDELEKLGGAAGIGFEFLEETFSRRYSPAEYRRRAPKARKVLSALLPDSSAVNIKGHSRTHEQLLAASGYDTTKELNELLNILDRKLRLITPVDAAATNKRDEDSSSLNRDYQLTHDYLVPSLRRWLAARRATTRSGRALAMVKERANLWAGSPNRRFLPTFFEWAQIQVYSDRNDWNESERKMMGEATRIHRRKVFAFVGCLCTGMGLLFFRSRAAKREKADQVVRRLMDVELDQVPKILPEVQEYKRWVNPQLNVMLQSGSPREATRASLALASESAEANDRLVNSLLEASAEDFVVFADAISGVDDEQIEILKGHFERVKTQTATSDETAKGFRSAIALSRFSPDTIDSKLDKEALMRELVAQNIVDLPSWTSQIRVPKNEFRDNLHWLYHKENRGAEQINAYQTALRFALEHAETENEFNWLAQVCCDGEVDTFHSTYDATEKHRNAMFAEFQWLLNHLPEPPVPNEHVRRRVNAAATLARLWQTEPIRVILHADRDRSAQTRFIHVAKRLGVPAEMIIPLLRVESDVPILYGMLLCLGEYDISEALQFEVVSIASRLYLHPDPGVHSASGWLLSRLDESKLEIAKSNALKNQPSNSAMPGRNWFFDPDERELAVVSIPPSDDMTETEANENEAGTGEAYRLAVMCRELTNDDVFNMLAKQDRPKEFEELQTWIESRLELEGGPNTLPFSPEHFYDVVAACNLMSWSAGLPRDQWCYETNEDGEYLHGVAIADDQDRRTGYRLPKKHEWITFAKANTVTPYYFGQDPEWMENYEWVRGNSMDKSTKTVGKQRVGQLKPSPFGLFDVLGNLSEWTQTNIKEQSFDRNGEFAVYGSAFWSHAVDCRYDRTASIGIRTDSTNVGIRAVRRYAD